MLNTKRKVLIILNYYLGFVLIYPIIMSIIGVFLSLAIGSVMKTSVATQLDIAMTLINFAVLVVTLATTLLLAKPFIIEQYNIFKNDIKYYLKQSLICFGKVYFVTFVISLIISFINPVGPANQADLEVMALQMPIFIIFTAVIFAPIVEEIVFRGVIFDWLKVKMTPLTAMLLSGFIFGGMHVVSSLLTGNYSDLIHVFTYAAMGFVLADGYQRTKCLATPVIAHFINNLIGVIIIFLV